MGIYTLFMVVGYFRPSEPLTVSRRDLQPPVPGTTSRWSVLLFPEDRPLRSKVYAANDSVELCCHWMPCFTRLLEVIHPGDPTSRLFPFDFETYYSVWKRTTQRLPVTAVPYQGRHSGPSIDAALQLRTRQERKDQGRWASEKSVLRYEKRARLVASFNKMPAEWQVHARECERRLEGLLLLGGSPEDLMLPATPA